MDGVVLEEMEVSSVSPSNKGATAVDDGVRVEGGGGNDSDKAVEVDLNQTWPFTRCRIVLQREEDPLEEGEGDDGGGGGGKGGTLKKGWELHGTKHVFYDKITSSEVKNMREQLRQLEESGMMMPRRGKKIGGTGSRTEDDGDDKPQARHGYHHPFVKIEADNDPVLDNNFNSFKGKGLGRMIPPNVVIDAVFKCPYCLIVFPEGGGLISHFETHHSLYLKKTTSGEAADDTKSPPVPVKKKEGHASPDDANHPPPGKASYIKIPSQNGKGLFQCTQCGKKFLWLARILEHLTSHSDDRPFPCEKCPKSFKTVWNLRSHVNLCHLGRRPPTKKGVPNRNPVPIIRHNEVNSGRRPFKCSRCPRSYKLKYGLTRHMRSHPEITSKFHPTALPKEDTGPYLCPQCPRRFPTGHELQSHLLRHSAKKNYKCSDCGQRFKHAQSLNRHVRNQHPTEEDIVQCQ